MSGRLQELRARLAEDKRYLELAQSEEQERELRLDVARTQHDIELIISTLEDGKLDRPGPLNLSGNSAKPEPAAAQSKEAPLTNELLKSLAHQIRCFLFFKDERTPLLIATWIVATYVYKRFHYFPILWINSPVMRCGKSKLIDVIDKLAWNSSGSTIIASPAALFRMASDGCTFLADEVESLKNSDREQYGAIMTILNAGFAPGAVVPRLEKTKGGGFELKRFAVYGPKVLAGINTVTETIKDRSLLIRMTRKAPGETVERLNMRVEGATFDQLRASMATWAEQNSEAIEKVYESLPQEGALKNCDDRFLDIIEPLLSILKFADAEAANGAERLTVKLMPLFRELGGQRAEAQTDEAILAMHTLLSAELAGEESRFIPAADLLEKAKQTPGLQWIGSTKSLSTFLSKIDIISRKDPTRTKRGYLVTRETLNDIQVRYIPLPPPG